MELSSKRRCCKTWVSSGTCLENSGLGLESGVVGREKRVSLNMCSMQYGENRDQGNEREFRPFKSWLPDRLHPQNVWFPHLLYKNNSFPLGRKHNVQYSTYVLESSLTWTRCPISAATSYNYISIKLSAVCDPRWLLGTSMQVRH